jgi:hypothetical protein
MTIAEDALNRLLGGLQDFIGDSAAEWRALDELVVELHKAIDTEVNQ